MATESLDVMSRDCRSRQEVRSEDNFAMIPKVYDEKAPWRQSGHLDP